MSRCGRHGRLWHRKQDNCIYTPRQTRSFRPAKCDATWHCRHALLLYLTFVSGHHLIFMCFSWSSQSHAAPCFTYPSCKWCKAARCGLSRVWIGWLCLVADAADNIKCPANMCCSSASTLCQHLVHAPAHVPLCAEHMWRGSGGEGRGGDGQDVCRFAARRALPAVSERVRGGAGQIYGCGAAGGACCLKFASCFPSGH